MKKIFSLLLCTVLMCTMLVSCEKEKIGDYLSEYEQGGETERNLTLNFYIIVGEGTSELAKQTVALQLNNHVYAKFKTTLKVHYLSETGYAEAVKAAIDKNDADSPNIVLINSTNMMNTLSSSLADLTKYIDGTTYGTLNTQIPKALIQGSKIDNKLYTIPNNHLIGEYKYLVVKADVANRYSFSTTETAPINSWKSLDDASDLIARMQGDGKNESEINDAVFMVNGSFEKRAEYIANGYVCNIAEYPTVTPEIAFSSAFAVVKNIDEAYHDRAMQIIYELNTNSEFRNLLQYGVKDTNYKLSGDVVTRINDSNNFYNMNLLYTGDIFKAYYCEELGWTEANRNNVFEQNEDSVLPAK